MTKNNPTIIAQNYTPIVSVKLIQQITSLTHTNSPELEGEVVERTGVKLQQGFGRIREIGLE